jgi:hypothetical protein
VASAAVREVVVAAEDTTVLAQLEEAEATCAKEEALMMAELALRQAIVML